MLKITKHLKEKVRKFTRRKTRINAKIKFNFPGYRIIADKSNLYMKAQVIDEKGVVHCHICDKGLKGKTKTERAELAGIELAKLMQKKNIEKAAFDRNGYLYHGRVKALAD